MRPVQKAAVGLLLLVILTACQMGSPAGFELTVTPPPNGLVNETVLLYARVTDAPFADGTHSWAFDFGDGNSGTIEQGTREFSLSHTYTEQGTFTITVTLKGQGQSVVKTAEVSVQQPPAIPTGRVTVTAEPIEAITQGWTVWAYSQDSGNARTASCRITDQDERDCIVRLQSLALELPPGEYEISVFPALAQDDPPGWVPRNPAGALEDVFNAWRQVVTITLDTDTPVRAEFTRAVDEASWLPTPR